jgi:hypothetical protein
LADTIKPATYASHNIHKPRQHQAHNPAQYEKRKQSYPVKDVLGVQVLHGSGDLQSCQADDTQVGGAGQAATAGAEPTPDGSVLQTQQRRQRQQRRQHNSQPGSVLRQQGQGQGGSGSGGSITVSQVLCCASKGKGKGAVAAAAA